MPGMDGLEVCSRIKARDNTRGTAVIAITGDSSPETAKQVLECGARVCLVKPLRAEVLLGELEAAMRR
jgi:two-component system, OmpR family, phosphate regulon response regulator PhoB